MRTCTSCWFDAGTPGFTNPTCRCCVDGHPNGHHDGCDHPRQCNWVEQTGIHLYPMPSYDPDDDWDD
jgi:hypothetical protein